MFAQFRKKIYQGLKISVPIALGAFASSYAYDKYYPGKQINAELNKDAKTDSSSLGQDWFYYERVSKLKKGQDQRWDWKPIIDIKQYDQVQRKVQRKVQDKVQVKAQDSDENQNSQQKPDKKTVFFFQKTGDQFIDQQVRKIFQKFVQKYFQNICETFQFAMLDYDEYSDPNSEMLILARKQQRSADAKNLYQLINWDKQKIFQPNCQKLFKQLLQILGSTPQISAANINEFVQQICTQNLQYPIKLILPAIAANDKAKNDAKDYMSFFSKFVPIDGYPGLQACITCDQLSQTILGFNNIQLNNRYSQYYFLTPLNRNLINLDQKKIIKINGKKFALLSSHDAYHKMVFPPVLSQMPKDGLQIFVNIDLNKAKDDKLDALFSEFAKQPIKGIKKHLSYSANKNPIQIIIKNRKMVRQLEESNKFPTGKSQSQLKDMLSHSYQWKYPNEQIKVEEFVKFMNEVREAAATYSRSPYQYFKSSQPSEQKFSVPLVGQQVKQQIQKNNQFQTNSVIFHYSKNCHSCNKFKTPYELIASQNANTNFYRIDNDTNKIKGMKSYNSTPIFAMYKHQVPLVPWYYKMPYFTKSLFENFVKIVGEVKPINLSTIQKNVKMHKQSKSLMTQLLKDVENYQIIEQKKKVKQIVEPINIKVEPTECKSKVFAESQFQAKLDSQGKQNDNVFEEKFQVRNGELQTSTPNEQHLLQEIKYNSKVDQL